jgi:hypothetical protein
MIASHNLSREWESGLIGLATSALVYLFFDLMHEYGTDWDTRPRPLSDISVCRFAQGTSRPQLPERHVPLRTTPSGK